MSRSPEVTVDLGGGAFKRDVGGLARGAGLTFKPLSPVSPKYADSCLATATRPTAGVGVVSIADFPTPAPNGQKTGIEIAMGAATFSGYQAPVEQPFTLAQAVKVGVLVYFPQTATAGGIANGVLVRLTFSSDASATGANFTKRWHFTFVANQIKPGWNMLTVAPSGDGTTEPNGGTWTVVGGMTSAETVTFIQVDIGGTVGGFSANVAQVVYWTERPAMPTLLIGFDDFTQTRLSTVAFPILEAAGIKAHLCGDGQAVKANSTRLKALYDAGWDIISQGWDHTAFGANGTNEAKLSLQYEQGRTLLNSYGMTRAIDLWAYPQSSFSTATTTTLDSKGVRLARAAVRGNIAVNPWGPDQVLIGSTDMGGKSLTTMIKRVDSLILYGETGATYVHDIVPGGDGTTPPADTLDWYQNDFQTWITYVKSKVDAGLLQTMTMTQWLAALKVAINDAYPRPF